MGVLDEAIRAHLELKRRSGADEHEVSRIEAEALGPARRDEPGRAPGEDGAEALADEPVVRWEEDAKHLPGEEPDGDPTVHLGAGDEPIEDETHVLEPEASSSGGGLRRRLRLRRAEPEPAADHEHGTNGARPEDDVDQGPPSDPRFGRDPDFDD